ncbi:MAG TPA: hypothetical protein ENJ31_08870 [Anaerolineae bacterium]|nr:hypothetical protein [Anaerolineae bacterium]
MTITRSGNLSPDTTVHRVGGGSVVNLRLKPIEEELSPPGISVFLGGTPQAAAEQLRRAFPRSSKWRGRQVVGTTTVAAVRQVGFDIMPDPTVRFPNHARLIHPAGVVGFVETNLENLSRVFQDTKGC